MKLYNLVCQGFLSVQFKLFSTHIVTCTIIIIFQRIISLTSCPSDLCVKMERESTITVLNLILLFFFFIIITFENRRSST